jgi:hypothetical protein
LSGKRNQCVGRSNKTPSSLSASWRLMRGICDVAKEFRGAILVVILSALLTIAVAWLFFVQLLGYFPHLTDLTCLEAK